MVFDFERTKSHTIKIRKRKKEINWERICPKIGKYGKRKHLLDSQSPKDEKFNSNNVTLFEKIKRK